jgi:hypothetical protein
MWIIDFGVGTTQAQAALYEAPFEYLRVHAEQSRAESRSRIRGWWLHERPRVDMRGAIMGLRRYLVTPTVAKHRLFLWLSPETLPDHQLIVIARDDDYTLGVLHSRVHEMWARGMGTQLREVESGFRYTPTTTFETFPFPVPTPEQRAGIETAARRLHELREGWLNPPGVSVAELAKRTLTNLYNARPTWLVQAHEALDRVVLDAYGWPPDVSDEDLLAKLLALNLAREPVNERSPQLPDSA